MWEEFQSIFESHVPFRLGEIILVGSLLKESNMLKSSLRNSLFEMFVKEYLVAHCIVLAED